MFQALKIELYIENNCLKRENGSGSDKSPLELQISPLSNYIVPYRQLGIPVKNFTRHTFHSFFFFSLILFSFFFLGEK